MSVSLHTLVHELCRDLMYAGEQQVDYRRALLLLINSVEWELKIENFTFHRSLVWHVRGILRLRHQRDELSKADKRESSRRWP